MFNNQAKVETLKRLITDTLGPLIDEDYSLLDAPYHNNIGDSLIFEGELAFLRLSSFKNLYSANIKFTKLNRLPKKGIILFHGGGNFGDIWPQYQRFRSKIIKDRPKQKVIIFPQTVYYENDENLQADAKVFNAHPNLTICARDRTSFNFLRKYFYNNTILLLPDMAFCLDLKSYHDSKMTGKVLLLKRLDKELKPNNNDPNSLLAANDKSKGLEVADWPGIKQSRQDEKYWKRQTRRNKYATRLLMFPKRRFLNPDMNFGAMKLFQSHNQMELGIQFINQYDTIYSTRLHGAILSILLNKPIYILDNSYGKNSAFYECWLTDFDNCHLI